MDSTFVNTKRAVQPTRPMVILGAGKQSEHVLRLLEWNGIQTKDIFLFDDVFPTRTKSRLENEIRGTLIEGIDFIAKNKQPLFIALGSRSAALRYVIFRKLQHLCIDIPNIIYKDTIISPRALLSSNTLIMPGCVISPGTTMGNLVTLFAQVTIEHDCHIDDNVTFGPGVVLSGSVRIEPHVFIGAGVTIAPEVTIGECCVIGAGSVVVRNIEPGCVALGSPARVVRKTGPSDDAPSEKALRSALKDISLQARRTP